MPLSIWFPIAVFAGMRLVDAIFIMVASRHQIPLTTASEAYYVYRPTPAAPDYWSVITNWDGQWYQRIATEGYLLPDRSGGLEASSAARAFNFLPLFPLLAGLLMAVTGLAFAPAASIVSLACGAAAMVVLFKVIERSGGRFAACSVVTLVSAFVSAPVMQLAYKESLVLLLLLLWFLWIQQHRYWWAAIAVLALCFAKYLTPPMALVLAAHALDRWRHRSSDPIRRRDWLGMATVLAVSAAGLFAWDIFVKIWLGNEADRLSIRGSAASVAKSKLGMFGQFYDLFGPVAAVIPVLVAVMLVVYAFTAHARSWGTEVRTWFWAYPIFLMAGTIAMPAMLRYLLPAFPLALIVIGSPEPGTNPRRKVWLVIACCIVGLALQWWWIDNVLVIQRPTSFWVP